MYNQLTPEIIEEIKKVSNNVFLGEEINPDYAKDEMPIYGTHMPDLAVQPRSTEEVAAVMKICYENNIPVTPRGAGTGLAGGAVPLYGGVLIDISKMNKIKSYDMENFVVEIEAGVLLNDLAEDCQSKGMLYPPDPGEKFACVGGNVATNAGGMSSLPGYDDAVDVSITTKKETITDKLQNTFTGGDKKTTVTTEAKSMREVFQGKSNSLYGSGIKGALNAVGSVMLLMIPWMISYIAVGLSYLISISNAIMLVAYGFCMPIALTQCFEDGQRSAGIRYLKKFAAQALTFMVIIIILYAVSKLQGALLPQLLQGLYKGNTLDINNDNFKEIIGNWKVLISIVVVQFAAVGAMLKGSQIANDIMGV